VSDCTTKGVRVQVEVEFLPHQSDPIAGLWLHAYHVTITNGGPRTVQLVARHWIITNSHGVEQHVRGQGVVGHQPVLKTGESFHYTSGCPMDTTVGSMHGSFEMVGDNGDGFDAVVAPFTLCEPYALN
jgi:ApaG protein